MRRQPPREKNHDMSKNIENALALIGTIAGRETWANDNGKF